MALTSNPYAFAAVLVLAAFVPPILYLAWVRNQERYQPEPWRPLAKAFAWGALGGTTLALLVQVWIGVPPHALEQIGVSSLLFTAVVLAPPIEEFTKALGLRWIDDHHVEIEDGLVYGAAVGFGFAATENLVYEIAAYMDGGTTLLVQTAVVRTLSTAFLHGTASALVGLALWRRRAGQGSAGGVLAAYGAAVLLHAAFNLGASLQLGLAFLGSLALAVGGFWWLRKRVSEIDRQTAPGGR